MTERFTLRREAKWIGVICGLIGLGLLAATALGVTWGCNFASPEKQRQATLAVCVGALFILVVGLWEFALAIRTAVITGGRSLFVRSLFSRQTIPWHEISRASWSMRFLGLTLHWPGGHWKVHLAHDGNPRSGRMQHLLRILRTRIDVDVQEGWNEHYERILNPRVITRAEHDATIRSMYRGVLLWGIPGGVAGGWCLLWDWRRW